MSAHWDRLRAGQPLFGCFLSTGYPINAELASRAGFDYVLIDLEHGMGSEADVLGQIYAVSKSGCEVAVRVESHERQRVHRLLDLGVGAIMFPRVDTAGEAAACVAAMRYQPEGQRGVATLIRAAGYGPDFAEYKAGTKRSLLGIIQIETAKAVENVEAIAAVDGADVLYVGPADLSTSLGIFKQFDHPKYLEAIDRTVAACKRYGRSAAILLPSYTETRKYLDLGFTFLTCGTDASFLLSAARQTNDAMRTA
jgi:4-hydroxy-2-oxoheptanedioate aldolase